MLDRITRIVLISLLLFLGLTALFGAIWVIPLLPLEWLSGTPFTNYTIPALALGTIGIGAIISAGLLVFRPAWGVVLTMCVGGAMSIFEVVETLVVGLDTWLYALHLGPQPDNTAPAFAGAADVAALFGIPMPLWLQPFYFLYGLTLFALALRLFVHTVRPAALSAHPATS